MSRTTSNFSEQASVTNQTKSEEISVNQFILNSHYTDNELSSGKLMISFLGKTIYKATQKLFSATFSMEVKLINYPINMLYG